MTRLYFVSHSIMIPNAPTRDPGPAREEIWENEQVKADHVVDVLLICHNIMQIRI